MGRTGTVPALAVLALNVLALAGCGRGPADEPERVAPLPGVLVQDRFDVTPSAYGQEETLARLFEALDRRELTVFATIDHAAAARAAGADMPPATLVVFGDPRAGTPLMREVPLLGIELPLKALVYEAEGETRLAVSGVANLARSYPLGEQDAILRRMAELTDGLEREVTGR